MKIIRDKNKEYLIDKKRELTIFNKIKELEKKKLLKKDNDILKLIKSQLEADWRKSIIIYLNKMAAKYKK